MFNIQELKIELEKYSDIIELSTFETECCLEFKVRNKTGRQTTYQRITNDYILPYYEQVDYRFSPPYVKGAYKKIMEK